ncbi:hypothetical protein DPMN_132393 [Dreissena polymorpha]|uniref:Uncharacterized protein n=1 Tax=Dreissena polymorpha TaxID=45954 RepID=A0A9D4JDS2_DREPO|nr:hypothetical protein DPMN_132393 [Dreissena polymorpha]
MIVGHIVEASRVEKSEWGHIFPPILTLFELVHEINKTNILTKFHDREKIHFRKTAPPPGGHVFQPTRTIFELKKRHIIYTNILAKLNLYFFYQNSVEIHEDRTRNAVSSVHKAKFHDGHRSIKYHHEHLRAYVS